MSDSSELLALRLALIGILLLFTLLAGILLRSGIGRPAPTARGAVVARTARLVLTSPARSGLEPGTVFQLAGPTTVGRDLTAGIVIADASISGAHAAIEPGPGGWSVRDLGSTNGTYLGRKQVHARASRLAPGASITFGSVTFRFEA